MSSWCGVLVLLKDDSFYIYLTLSTDPKFNDRNAKKVVHDSGRMELFFLPNMFCDKRLFIFWT